VRILFDATTASTGVGGLTTYVGSLLGAWAEVSPEDQFLTLINHDAPDEIRRAAESVGIVKTVGRRGAAFRLAIQQCVVPYLLRRFSPDVLLAAAPDMPVLVSFSVPLVTVVHDLRHLSHPDQFGRAQAAYRRLAHAQSYRKSKGLVAISEATAKALRRTYSRTADKIVVAHHGADHVDLWPRVAKQKQALAFAQWANKRPEVAVRVWADLRKEIPGFDWVLNIVGTPPRAASMLRILADELQVSNLTRVHGFLPPATFHELFTASQLVLFPTTEEGFGLPIVEAMRLGIPVVTSDIPAAHEVGGDWVIYTDLSSTEQIVASCHAAITDQTLRKELIEGGKTWSSQFTWRRTVEETRLALQKVCR
jgi:glycosyltransferase involved in cell wall biosynthesis